MIHDRDYEMWVEEFITELALQISVSEEDARMYVEELGDHGLMDQFKAGMSPKEAAVDEVDCWELVSEFRKALH